MLFHCFTSVSDIFTQSETGFSLIFPILPFICFIVSFKIEKVNNIRNIEDIG